MHECLSVTTIWLFHLFKKKRKKEAIVHWEESGWNLNVLSATFFCSQVLWKSLHWNLFCSSPLFHFPARKLLFGSILGLISVSLSLFPPVSAMPSKNGFTPHVLRDGGCFHFYPLFLKWKELRNWHFKNWWVRLRMACGEEWSDEWANGEKRETRLDVQWKSPNLTAFWVCEWKLRVRRAPSHTWTFIN